MASPVQIVVIGLAGPRCTVEASTDWTILQVHKAISEQINVPVDGQTLLKDTEKLAWEVSIGTLTSGNSETLQLTLLVEEVPEVGPSALREAIEKREAAIALALLRRRQLPGLNEVDSHRGTLLEHALTYQLPEVALAIVARQDFTRINATYRMAMGSTALHAAAEAGDLAVCQAIVGRPDFSQLWAVNQSGCTALEVAQRHPAVAEFLEKAEDAADPEPGALLAAIGRGDQFTARRLLSRPQPPGLSNLNQDGGSVLHFALGRKLHEVASAIVARQDFSLINAKESQGRTALHFAALQGSLPLCRAIIERGDFTELLAVAGREAASETAQRRGHKAVAEFLRGAEAQVPWR